MKCIRYSFLVLVLYLVSINQGTSGLKIGSDQHHGHDLGVGVVPQAQLCGISQDDLTSLILTAINQANFADTWDLEANETTHAINNLDISLVVFQNTSLCENDDEKNPSVIYSSVLLSRDWPTGKVMTYSEPDLTIQNIDWRWWDYDRWNVNMTAQWNAPPSGDWFGQLVPGATGPVWMSPHPASCFKLMLATGVMLGLQAGLLDLSQDASLNITVYPDGGGYFWWKGDLNSSLHAMLQVSDNNAAASVIAALQEIDILPTKLMTFFHSLGLYTLAVNGTQPGGYWGPDIQYRNRSVELDTTGFFTMTSWDAVRLMWLIDPFRSVEPNWTVNGVPVNATFLEMEYREMFYNILVGQSWHNALSTTANCGAEGRVPGIASFEPQQWVHPNGSVIIFVDHEVDLITTNVEPCNEQAEVLFAHKTGITTDFGSNVGFITNLEGFPERKYIIGLLGNVGTRFTDESLLAISPNPCFDPTLQLCYTQKLPLLASIIDSYLSTHTPQVSDLN